LFDFLNKPSILPPTTASQLAMDPASITIIVGVFALLINEGVKVFLKIKKSKCSSCLEVEMDTAEPTLPTSPILPTVAPTASKQ